MDFKKIFLIKEARLPRGRHCITYLCINTFYFNFVFSLRNFKKKQKFSLEQSENEWEVYSRYIYTSMPWTVL